MTVLKFCPDFSVSIASCYMFVEKSTDSRSEKKFSPFIRIKAQSSTVHDVSRMFLSIHRSLRPVGKKKKKSEFTQLIFLTTTGCRQ